jgi:tetrahydromethanopterin S-methyltransferase subunit E
MYNYILIHLVNNTYRFSCLNAIKGITFFLLGKSTGPIVIIVERIFVDTFLGGRGGGDQRNEALFVLDEFFN